MKKDGRTALRKKFRFHNFISNYIGAQKQRRLRAIKELTWGIRPLQDKRKSGFALRNTAAVFRERHFSYAQQNDSII